MPVRATICERTNALVEKYSPDQTEFALRRLEESLSWGRRLLVRRFNILVPVLHGDWMREVFSAPEDGYASAPGNLLVQHGLANISYLLLGLTASGTSGYPLKVSNGTDAGAICGVGTGTTAAGVTDAALENDGTANAYYQMMDTTYPQWAGAGTANGGELEGQCTVGNSSANFQWNEWCWASCVYGAITAGSTLASVASDVAMLNHEVPTATLGSKGAGATWVFATTMTFS